MFKKKKKEIEYVECAVNGKCRHCWYWEKNEEQSLTTEFGTIVMGVCHCDETFDFIWWKGDRDKTDVEIGDLFTHETFGCTNWTEEEPD